LALTILVSSASTSVPVLTITKVDIGYKVAWPPDACTTARNDVQREINLVRAWFHVRCCISSRASPARPRRTCCT
jgi:hypothetical protein